MLSDDILCTLSYIDFKHLFILQTLYKSQIRELQEDLEEKIKQNSELETDFKSVEKERDTLGGQLQLALAKADSEQLARSIAEEQLSDLEKEKTMLGLELKESLSNTREKDFKISSVSFPTHELNSGFEQYLRMCSRVIRLILFM